jgi:transcriptional regulator with XRE-family HTH domain
MHGQLYHTFMSKSTRIALGKKIVALRNERKLTQKKFALMVGLDRSYLLDVEYGRRNIAIDNLERIAQGFDISLSELLEGLATEPNMKH